LVRFATIARILKPRGVRGQVRAELLTDFPERFSSLHEVCVVVSEREFQEQIEEYWFQKGRIILKFLGRDSREEVEELIGGEVTIPEEQRVPLPEDIYYYSDLRGCSIIERGQILGKVTDILEIGSAGHNLVVTGTDREEFMVPMARRFILSIDPESKKIEVDLPAGLLSNS